MYPDEYRVMFELEDGYWWYRGLRTLLQALLARYVPSAAPRALLLDVGCGTGANLQLLQAYGRAIGVDLAEQAIAFCRARAIPSDRAFVASASELPFPDGLFDLAISFEVICNIADDRRAFAEIVRVLMPGGRCIIQMPAYQWLWSMHDVAVGHQRRYAARDLREKLEGTGLEVERLTHANVLFFPLIAAARLGRRLLPERSRAVRSDLTPLPRALNAALAALYCAEMRAVARVDVPYGLSLIAVARKRGKRIGER